MKSIYIKARSDGKIYLAELGNLKLEPGDQVLFETEQCQEVALVLNTTSTNEGEGENVSGAEKAVVIRRINEKDLEIDRQKKDEARENLERCKIIVSKHQLPMELLDADISFDGKKLTFYFSAPGRVDFRSLVSELASTFQKLIRLQQVGSRDRARCVGGIGRCGEHFCCNRFLKNELEGITVDMAYEQGLGQMGSNRVTGACGKLMCCLKFELDFYQEARNKMPAIGSEIKTAKGMGRVISQCVVKNYVTVELENKSRLEVDCSK